MLGILSYLTSGFDLRPTLIAGFVCIHASFTAIILFQRAAAAQGSGRIVWIATCGVTTGLGIWATHFVGTLAFAPAAAATHDAWLILLSLATAVILTAGGVGFAICGPAHWNAPLGGVIIGSAIALVNYLVIVALGLSGQVTWHLDFMFLSIALSILFATASQMLATRGQDIRTTFLCAFLLVLAIFGHQFTAMSAAHIMSETPSPAVAFSLSPTSFALLIACASALVLEVGLVGAFMDRKATAQALEAAARFRALAEATTEGLVICDEGIIVNLNTKFEELVGATSAALCGIHIRQLVHETSAATTLGPYPVEVALNGPNGEPIPCVAVARMIPHGKEMRMVVSFTDLRDRKRAEARIAHLIHHDVLTDLPNRAAFNEHLAFALGTRRSFALLCVDLDRFKEVNDLFGHSVGDGLLCEVSRRLHSAAEGAFLARIGGDEFTLITADDPQPATASALADRLVAAVADDIEIDGHRLRIGITIGVAVYPAHGADAKTLLRNADAALYRAKGEGRGTIRFFDADMAKRLRDGRALKHDLQSAIAFGEIILNYQPQARIDGQVIGFEALARWHHPRRGLVPPDTFIPLSEENGLIVPIGEWILREACREAASWPRPLQIAVNLSPIQFRRGDLSQLVLSILLETGLEPSRLELEITEGVLIDDFSRTLSILRKLRSLGVAIVMDDFGSGYSSLSYLQSFPFNKIKIDKTFISKLDRNSEPPIVRAAIALARGLGLPVVAEGVETREQLALLTREGCDQVQGYLIGRPRTIDDYAGLVGHPPDAPRADPAEVKVPSAPIRRRSANKAASSSRPPSIRKL